MLASSSGEEVRRLLVERAALVQRLSELDAVTERLTRSVQRVGGPIQASRAFSGGPPLNVGSAANLEQQVDRLTGEMQQLAATISQQELKLHDIDRPSRRRRAFRVLLVLLFVAAAAAAAVYLAVR